MTGWSAVSTYELVSGVKLNKHNASPVLVKTSKREFKNFTLDIILDSHDDTGEDRFTVYYGNIAIYKKQFGDTPIETKLEIHLYEASKLKFVIDNDVYGSPGATSAMIKIKEL